MLQHQSFRRWVPLYTAGSVCFAGTLWTAAVVGSPDTSGSLVGNLLPIASVTILSVAAAVLALTHRDSRVTGRLFYIGVCIALAGQCTVLVSPAFIHETPRAANTFTVVAAVVAAAGYLLCGMGAGYVVALWRERRVAGEPPSISEVDSHSPTDGATGSHEVDNVARLAGGIAHDFNNLLTAILGYASLIKGLSGRDDRIVSHIRTIETSAERGAVLARRLLEFSGHRSLELRVIDPTLLLSDTTTSVQRMVDEHVYCEMLIGSDLPYIEADPVRVHQAVTDVCQNGWEAMPDGGTLRLVASRIAVDGPLATVTGDRVPAGTYLRISISDTGIGMDSEVLGQVFEPFFTTKRPGAGLGLSSALGIVRQHNGGIDINSEVGYGTRVDIYLPGTTRQLSPLTVSHKPTRDHAGTVLVVDDEDAVRRVATAILDRLGYTVLSARNGSEGVGIYAEHVGTIDLVILDYKMPRMNGVEAAERICRIDPDARIVLCTDCGDNGAIGQIPYDFIDEFIIKPYTFSDMAETVDRVVGAAKAAI